MNHIDLHQFSHSLIYLFQLRIECVCALDTYDIFAPSYACRECTQGSDEFPYCGDVPYAAAVYRTDTDGRFQLKVAIFVTNKASMYFSNIIDHVL